MDLIMADERYADPGLRAFDIERLAALIRQVDGNHDLGAGELAERLIDRGVRPPVDVDDGKYAIKDTATGEIVLVGVYKTAVDAQGWVDSRPGLPYEVVVVE